MGLDPIGQYSGPVFCLQFVARRMRDRRKGKIANISSISGKSSRGRATPAMQLQRRQHPRSHRVAAAELGSYNINVNCVCPGPTFTSMMRNLKNDEPEALERLKARFGPWDGSGDPVDIANAVIFLSSHLADDITGRPINVDNGTMWDRSGMSRSGLFSRSGVVYRRDPAAFEGSHEMLSRSAVADVHEDGGHPRLPDDDASRHATVRPGQRAVGPAVTAFAFPGDNLMHTSRCRLQSRETSSSSMRFWLTVLECEPRHPWGSPMVSLGRSSTDRFGIPKTLRA